MNIIWHQAKIKQKKSGRTRPLLRPQGEAKILYK
jgi:hypothetical protein